MATSSYVKSLLGGIQAELRAPLERAFAYVFDRTLEFGPIDTADAQTQTTNFRGRYVKVVTSATASLETAVAHGLGRTPNVLWQVSNPRVVNSKVGIELTISRAADPTRFYVASPSTAATIWLYVE